MVTKKKPNVNALEQATKMSLPSRQLPSLPPPIDPSQKPTKNTSFNPDGTVTITPSGLPSTTLNAGEYEAYLARQRSGLSGDGSKGEKINTPKLNQLAGNEAQGRVNANITEEQRRAAAGIGQLTPEQMNKDVILGEGDVGTAQVGAATFVGALAGGGTGAALGALGGPLAPVTVPVGAIGGAIVGGVSAGFTKIGASKRQDVKQAFNVYKASKGNMGWIINEVNAGRLSPSDARAMFDEELANFNAAYRNVKKDTDSNLDRFLSGGADELATMEGTRRRLPQYEFQLEQALLTPNPMATPISFAEFENETQ